jgi:hypothetical protein
LKRKNKNKIIIFDLINFETEDYENRSVNVLFQNDLFKTRVIVLEASSGARLMGVQIKTGK